MTSVEPSHFCIDRSVFPNAGCLTCNRPSIMLVLPVAVVVFPKTVRVSEYLIKGSRCSYFIVRASVPRGRIGPDRATFSFQVPERFGCSIGETCPANARTATIELKLTNTRSIRTVYLVCREEVGRTPVAIPDPMKVADNGAMTRSRARRQVIEAAHSDRRAISG